MRSEPAECSCCWELRTGTTTSEIFTASHAPTTPCMCVSVGAAEHSPPDWGPCWQQQEAGVGSRGKSSSLCLTGHLEMSDGDLCQHTVLLCSWQPRGRMRQGQSRTTQTDLTKQCRGYSETRARMRSDSTKPTQMPGKDQQLHSKVQSAVWKSQKHRLDPAWHRRGCGTEWQTVGVSTVCYSFSIWSKMLPKTEEWKKCLKSNVLV